MKLDRIRHWLAWHLLGKPEHFELRQTVAEARAGMRDNPLTGPAIEKLRLHGIAQRCVRLVARDRAKVLDQIHRANLASTDTFWTMPGEELAARLWDGWTEEERDGIEVEAGYCITEHKQWFRVRGEPELVEEPSWNYEIDPIPVGICLYDQIYEPAPRILVVEPMSPFSRLYSAIEGVVRPKAA